jgi:hypothetical protein
MNCYKICKVNKMWSERLLDSMFFNILLCSFSCFVYLFSVLCILCCCIALCDVSSFVYSYLFPIFVQVYRPLPPDGNRIAVNKYHHHHHHHHQINLINPSTKFQLLVLCTEQFVSMTLTSQTNTFDTFCSRRLYISDFIRLVHYYSRLVFHPEEPLNMRSFTDQKARRQLAAHG